MSVDVKEVVEVEHVAGCRRNKGCGPTCKRIKQKGEWEAHITVRPPGKKPVRRRQRIPSEYARTATERWGWAETQEQLLKEELNAKAGENYTFAQLAEGWIEQQKADGVESIIDDEPCLRRHVLPVLGPLRLADVRRRHGVELITKLKQKPSPKGGLLAPRTVRRAYFTARAVCDYGVLMEYLPANPLVLPRRMRVLPKLEDKDPAWRRGDLRR